MPKDIEKIESLLESLPDQTLTGSVGYFAEQNDLTDED